MQVGENRMRIGRTAALLLALLCGSAGLAAAPEKADVRVLIDISGSMRQNDPDNLRRPALRMLAGLLQPGTQAGVWTFARWVNNLVPVAEVDAAWKKRVLSLSEQISSPGQFTNIEEVLDRASRDWSGDPATHSRHLVLLTDGVVDVSKDAAENAGSRSRIIDGLLPRLAAAGVKIHTIALSEHADHELMKRLAGDTGGRYQQVAHADELQRVFLRMFETVGSPDSVPLQGNRFVVDSSINEATVLVFSRPDSPPVVLRSPSGDEYRDSDLPGGVAWYRDLGYDLITIASPQKGEWTLQADLDPDNRVMIVTDLRLQTSEVPSHVSAGEPVHIDTHLTNRGELVARQAFLKLLDVRAESGVAGETSALPLNDLGEDGDEKAGDGRYGMNYGAAEPHEEVELLIAVESPTFMREKRFRLVVHEPVTAEIGGAAEGLELQVTAESAVLQPGAMVSAWQQDSGAGRLPLPLSEVAPGQWSGALSDPASPAYLKVSGTTRLGNPIERTLGPLMPPGVTSTVVADPVPAPEPPPAEVSPTQSAAPVDSQAAATPEAEVEQPEQPEEATWVMPAVMFGAFNLTLLIAAAAWYLVRRRKGPAADDLDELLDDVDADATREAETSPREAA